MKWLDNWLYGKVRDMWDNRHKYEEDRDYQEAKRNRGLTMSSGMAIPKSLVAGSPEGEDRITFELTSAVGGRILNVRRYDPRKDQHDQQTYVIPSGEDVGERVAKILNLELLK